MSSHCLAGQEADYSEPSCSDSITSDMSNLTTIASETLHKESKMDTSTTRPFTAMSEHSLIQDDVTFIEALRTSSLLDFHANHFQLQENEKHQTMNETCGQQQWKLSKESSQPFASLKTSPDYSQPQWMTPQMDLFATMERFSETWPKAGMMRNGVCWGLMMSELYTTENDYGFLPTPSVAAARQGQNESDGRRGQTLIGAARGQMWPTPNAQERGGKQSPGSHLPLTKAVQGWRKDGTQYLPTPNTMDHLPPRSQEGIQRQFAVSRKGRTAPANLREWIHPEMWPTPESRDYKSTHADNSDAFKTRMNHCRGVSLPEQVQRHAHGVGGQLNPNWVEWLMGWPIGWTDLKPLETDKFQQWWQQHTEHFQNSGSKHES